ncbi:PREDICTED: DNA polymerase epsilon subunit C [Populus euphratica]|uniref:DNA polymerase epsilon subunit C n=1 Tax=Populus euphratica TaxID=75702 RepID=A0AAJ6VAN8_POPEU|nr:PREDICTED: DNA polymerase epsilon subunit C [Populus euphratica]
MKRVAKSKREMKKKKSSSKEVVVITKSKQENKKSKSKTSNISPREPVVLLLSSSSSSSDSQEIIEIEGEDDETKSGIKNRSMKSSKIKSANNAKRKGKDDDFDGEGDEDGTACWFPMARIKRIINSEDTESLLNQDVVFLVNKATEKFLEQFSDEAYDYTVQDRKKSLAYKHLSTVVSKRRRFDFLSDFVPEKLNAKDALADRKLAMTGQG